jgi:phosphatidylethanolamine/phosphatidyl-N-methylethanolamine N-methyltransferase
MFKFFKNKNIKYFYYDDNKIQFKKNYFDRIIISHTLEHIPFPEKFLKSVLKTLKKGGVVSISLPTDPGFLWRLGSFYNKIFNIKKNLNLDNLEYDYMNAIEHINSIYNLVSIIRYDFKNKVKENFLPFKIKILDLNLFYNVHIIK